jgi:hypothetical protein
MTGLATWSYVQPAWSADGLSLYAKQGEETNDHEFGDVVRIRLEQFQLR